MSKRLVQLTATFFYIGFLPLAPGSMASVAGLALAVIFHSQVVFYLVVLAAVTGLGFWAGGKMEKISNEKDPSCVVIDEVSGMMIAMFMLPVTMEVLWCTFFLFRAFDMFKIPPGDRMEQIKGSTGIMMDDVVAGVYTNLIMQIAVRLAGLA